MELPLVGEVSRAVPVAVLLGAAWVATTVAWVVDRGRLRRSRARAARLAAEVEAVRAGDPRPRRPVGVAAHAERAVRAAVTTVARVREQGLPSLLVSSIEDLTRWAVEDRAEIARVSAPDGTVTVLFSDVVDSTALNERLGDEAYVRVLEAHDALVREQVEEHGGHVVKSQGDGFMVVFGDPAEAVAAALAVQEGLRSPRSRRLRRSPLEVRIGAHTGPTITRDGDYFGRTVALAARVAARGGAGEVLVTDDLRAALPDRGEDLPLAWEEHGWAELKGLTGQHLLWRVA